MFKKLNYKYVAQKIAIGLVGAAAIGVAYKTEKSAQEKLGAKYDKKKTKNETPA